MAKKFLLIFTGPDKLDYLGAEPLYKSNVQKILNMGATDYLLLTNARFNMAESDKPILTTKIMDEEYLSTNPSFYPAAKKQQILGTLTTEIAESNGLAESQNYTLVRYTEQLIKVAKGLISGNSSVRLWFGFPQFLLSAQPAAMRYVDFYKTYIIDEIVANIPDKNIEGFYFGQEDLNFYYTPFNANKSDFGNAVYQSMEALSKIVKTCLKKKFLWIPYFHNEVATQTLTNITDDGLRIGYIANTKTVFDYVLLQPSALNDSTNDYRLSQVKACIECTPPTVVNKNGDEIGSRIADAAAIGFEMEIGDLYAKGDEKAKNQYKKYVAEFGAYYNGSVPYAFYAGNQESLIFTIVGDRVSEFFKTGKNGDK